MNKDYNNNLSRSSNEDDCIAEVGSETTGDEDDEYDESDYSESSEERSPKLEKIISKKQFRDSGIEMEWIGSLDVGMLNLEDFPGLRFSILWKVLNQGSVARKLLPKLQESGLGFSDLFLDVPSIDLMEIRNPYGPPSNARISDSMFEWDFLTSQV
ncbi:hypothetical protein BJ742DRAFT_744035 [Cladochytrium replicatum]|nr:hypothetical protein BJ742DRAFT_744035 [Cladochytrium replicatum]